MLSNRHIPPRVDAAGSATLVGIAGPVKGAILTLDSKELSIGRDQGNVLVIDEPAVSRQHCLVRAGEDGYRIRDLASRNGTYVNGMPVKERTLHNGDQIQVGYCAMLFVAQNETGPSAGRLAEDLVQDRKTVVLHKQEAVYLATDTVPDVSPRPTRVCRDLTTLLRISARINSLRDRDELHAGPATGRGAARRDPQRGRQGGQRGGADLAVHHRYGSARGDRGGIFRALGHARVDCAGLGRLLLLSLS